MLGGGGHLDTTFGLPGVRTRPPLTTLDVTQLRRAKGWKSEHEGTALPLSSPHLPGQRETGLGQLPRLQGSGFLSSGALQSGEEGEVNSRPGFHQTAHSPA